MSKYFVLLHTLDPWIRSKGRNNFFLKVMYKERSLEHACKMFDLMHTSDLLDWVKRSDIEIVQISIF